MHGVRHPRSGEGFLRRENRADCDGARRADWDGTRRSSQHVRREATGRCEALSNEFCPTSQNYAPQKARRSGRGGRDQAGVQNLTERTRWRKRSKNSESKTKGLQCNVTEKQGALRRQFKSASGSCSTKWKTKAGCSPFTIGESETGELRWNVMSGAFATQEGTA